MALSLSGKRHSDGAGASPLNSVDGRRVLFIVQLPKKAPTINSVPEAAERDVHTQGDVLPASTTYVCERRTSYRGFRRHIDGLARSIDREGQGQLEGRWMRREGCATRNQEEEETHNNEDTRLRY